MFGRSVGISFFYSSFVFQPKSHFVSELGFCDNSRKCKACSTGIYGISLYYIQKKSRSVKRKQETLPCMQAAKVFKNLFLMIVRI